MRKGELNAGSRARKRMHKETMEEWFGRLVEKYPSAAEELGRVMMTPTPAAFKDPEHWPDTPEQREAREQMKFYGIKPEKGRR
jgi:hypothetical protein